MLDIRRAIEYLTEDEQAKKEILIGALLTAISLANVAAFGYEVEVTRSCLIAPWSASSCGPAPIQF